MRFLKKIAKSPQFWLNAPLGVLIWMAANDANTVKSNLSTWLPEGWLSAFPWLQTKALDQWVLGISIILALFLFVSLFVSLSRPREKTISKEKPPNINVNMRDGNSVNQIGHRIDDGKER